jgi:DNA polymerase-3 subunit delta
MSKPKPDQFRRALESGKLSNVYLFHGEDSRSIDRALQAVEERVLTGDLAEFNADYFHGKECEASSVLAAAQSLPVMADRRLVVIRHVEELKGSARELLTGYMAAPNQSTVLVLCAGALALRGASAKKEDKALVEASAKAGESVHFARPTANRLPGLIQELVRERGKQIEKPAVEILVDLAGGETLGLEQEIDKVVLYVGDRERITREDALEAVADIKEANVFEFTDAVGACDVEAALRSLRRMREQGHEALMILGMLLRHFRLIWKIKEYQDRGEPPARIAKLTRLNEWILKNNYLPQLKKFSAADTGRITRALADLDMKLKSTRGEKDIIFERVIVKLCLGRLA